MDTKTTNGGPVGPIQQQILPDGILIYAHSGMTLRDYFAGQALVGLIGANHPKNSFFWDNPNGRTMDDWISSNAYALADAMIAARKEPA